MEREQAGYGMLTDLSTGKVDAIPSVDIKAESKDGKMVAVHSFPVVSPEGDSNEFIVQVRASVLSACRRRLRAMHEDNRWVNDLLFGLAMTSCGAILNAAAVGVALDSTEGRVSFVVLPPLFVGTMVAFVLRRQARNRDGNDLAAELLDRLPDPDHTKGVLRGE
jgi:hypothetical protein